MKPINAAQIALALARPGVKPRRERLILDRSKLPANIDLPKELAASLLNAQGIYKGSATYIHSLIGVDQLTDDEFQEYLLTLAPYAVSSATLGRIAPPSPSLVGLLLGGLTIPEVERQIHRALTLLDAFPDELPPSMTEALHAVGHGPNIRHNQPPAAITNVRKGAAFNWLASLPRTQSYASQVLTQGGIQAALASRLAKVQDKVLRYANTLLTPGAHRYSMTQFAYDIDPPRPVDEVDYRIAVSKLFEGDWADLMLTGKGDGPVIVARCLLIELCSSGARSHAEPPVMTGQQLVGIAMLTGISVAKWAEFAVNDLHRRGESFMAASAIDDAVEIIQTTELGAWFACEAELRELSAQLHLPDHDKVKRAQRLRKAKWPLWTDREDGGYYLLSTEPTYSHAPEVSE